MTCRFPLRPALFALVCMASAACAELTPPPHPGGQALWRIVHDQCMPDQLVQGDPAPCALVHLGQGGRQGYAVLKDRRGPTQYLLIPTARITGVEDPVLLAPDTANFFALAWDQRRFVEAHLGRPLDRTRVSVAVNSAYGRSQDQLHLHIDCVDAGVAATLASSGVSRAGAERAVMLKRHSYRVRWVAADQLTALDPFKQLVRGGLGAPRDMAAWSLALVGGVSPEGRPGFYLLTHHADPAAGDLGSAEELQDHACASG